MSRLMTAVAQYRSSPEKEHEQQLYTVVQEEHAVFVNQSEFERTRCT